MNLTGLHTAIVTPFFENGDIDFEKYRSLLRTQIASGVQGVVVCGSTGETATISVSEKEKLFAVSKEELDEKALFIAGTGSNDTRATVELSKLATKAGADALLIVTPYYNKPTVAGIVGHHSEIASAVSTPQIMYNVPGRTATNMSASTQVEIAEKIPSVIATKEASANLEQMAEIIRNAPRGFQLLAGDDSLALPIISLGGLGVIAVISNYAPKKYGRLIQAALSGDYKKAASIQMELMPLYKMNFIESNPIPVKYIMEVLSFGTAHYRLPMCQPSAASKDAIKDLMGGFVDNA